MEDGAKITIGFKYINEFKDKFEAESEFEVIEEVGDDTLIEIGRQFNTFLRQAGYIRRNDFIFTEDVTDEEYDALQDFLDEYRAKKQRKRGYINASRIGKSISKQNGENG